jgi:predicted RNA-binding Zn ribbon-like protein
MSDAFKTNFDPFQALLDLDRACQALDRNHKQMVAAHNHLANTVKEQGEVIDVLIKGLDASNKANEMLLKDMLANITETFKGVK